MQERVAFSVVLQIFLRRSEVRLQTSNGSVKQSCPEAAGKSRSLVADKKCQQCFGIDLARCRQQNLWHRDLFSAVGLIDHLVDVLG